MFKHLVVFVSAVDCGEDIYLPEGSVSSQNYPQAYPDNHLCAWKISASRDDLNILVSDMKIEKAVLGCSYDSLSVSDYLVTFWNTTTGAKCRVYNSLFQQGDMSPYTHYTYIPTHTYRHNINTSKLARLLP